MEKLGRSWNLRSCFCSLSKGSALGKGRQAGWLGLSWGLRVSLDALRKHCEKDFEGLWSCFLELLGGRDLSENGEGCK